MSNKNELRLRRLKSLSFLKHCKTNAVGKGLSAVSRFKVRPQSDLNLAYNMYINYTYTIQHFIQFYFVIVLPLSALCFRLTFFLEIPVFLYMDDLNCKRHLSKYLGKTTDEETIFGKGHSSIQFMNLFVLIIVKLLTIDK